MKYIALTLPGGQTIDTPAGIPTGGFIGSNTGNDIISWALTIFFVVAAVTALFLIIYAGIQWVTSGGDKEKLAMARKRIIYAIVGLVVIVLSVIIMNTLLGFFGQTQFGAPQM